MIDATFTAWRGRLLRFCGQLLRNTHDAEEVVQDVFASLLAKHGRYDLTDPGVLLFRLARNRCIDLRRKARAGARRNDPKFDAAVQQFQRIAAELGQLGAIPEAR